MATASLAVIALLSLLLAASCLGAKPLTLETVRDVPTVDALNVTQYLGLWYQVYTDAFNAIFEPNAYCATARYGLNPNGTVSVLNIDNQGGYNGTRGEVQGYALQPNPTTFPGRLEVVFPFNPIPGPYWILQLGPVINDQYQYSVVSDFDKLTLFVLTRDVNEYNSKYSAKVADFLSTSGFSGLFNTPYAVPQGPDCDYTA